MNQHNLIPEDRDFSVLVVGVGSIGRRHMRNLRAMGFGRVCGCDPQATPEAVKLMNDLEVNHYEDYSMALNHSRPDAVLVCSPPVSHIPIALQAVRAGAHVFVEKPLSHTLDEVDTLEQEAGIRGKILQVGYNLRFHPGLRIIRKLLNDGEIGRLLWIYVESGSYLPDWRPHTDYRNSYSGRSDLGGGIILDASHELDYAIWLGGEPREVTCVTGKLSELEINVEDTATLILRFSNGTEAVIHLDFFQRWYSRSCKLVCESGTIIWDFLNNSVKLFKTQGEAQVRFQGVFDPNQMYRSEDWQEFEYAFDSNQMYIDELLGFFRCIHKRESPEVGLKQGKDVLRTVLAAYRSSNEGRKIVL